MTVNNNETEHRFEAGTGPHLAVLEYRREGDALELTHTEVPEQYEGQGIGGALARAAMEFARQNHLQVRPYCSFVASWLKRHQEYQDLVEIGFAR
jgi:predicted GNAT family acetyltransferase